MCLLALLTLDICSLPYVHAKRHVLHTAAAAPSVCSPSLQRRADGEASPRRVAASRNSMSVEKRRIASRPALLAGLLLPVASRCVFTHIIK